jgi:GNAT superfamily N-acetyltransferase
MRLVLRPPTLDDAPVLGQIAYDAFRVIAERHGFPPDFPSPEFAGAVMSMLISHRSIYGVAVEADGRLIGSNFLDERSPVAGVGPITVDPTAQNAAVGRRLMEAVLTRAAARGFPGVRLVQAAYHCRSLSLYTKLGFDPREPLSTMHGAPLLRRYAGYDVRPATEADLAACNALCRRVHGHDRGGELADAITQGSARVVEHAGAITGYATGIAFFGHAVGETNRELQALIAASEHLPPPGFLVPTRNAALMRWCLAQGLRIVQPMTLMSVGVYNQPAGAFLPSILY